MKKYKNVITDTSKKRAFYKIGDMNLLGYVTESTDGLYWFNTQERMDEGRPDLLVSASELKILII